MFKNRLIKKIEKAGLIGRGCNNFATAGKWQAVRKAKADEKFVICNVSESEPGVFKDRYVLRNFKEAVVEGIGLGMSTVGASKGFIYLNPEYYDEFGADLLDVIKSKAFDIEVFAKPLHDYVGGEETAVCNSMEGSRVEPRLKPPFPTVSGFNGKPTLVNNCETFYAVSLINSGSYQGTKICCILDQDGTEHITEVHADVTISKALKEIGHQVSADFFYQVGGGAAGSCFNHRQLNRKFTGLASVIIYQREVSEKDTVLKWASFFRDESCGQCVPCREGTYRLSNMLENYYLAGKEIEVQVFEDLVFSLQNTSFCPVGRVSLNAILSYWENVLGKKNAVSSFGDKCEN